MLAVGCLFRDHQLGSAAAGCFETIHRHNAPSPQRGLKPNDALFTVLGQTSDDEVIGLAGERCAGMDQFGLPIAVEVFEEDSVADFFF